MKSIHKILITVFTATLASISSAHGAVTISVSFSPVLTGGTDTNGFEGSTWSFTFQLNDPVYSDYFGGAAVLSDGATLSIAGAGNAAFNGDYPLVENATTDFLFWPNYGGLGTAYLAHNPSTGSESYSSFDLGVNTVALDAMAFTGPSTASATIGGPVLASHYDGLVVSDGGISVGGTVYGFNNGTVTVIPEPSTLPLVAFSGGFLLLSRRRGKLSR